MENINTDYDLLKILIFIKGRIEKLWSGGGGSPLRFKAKLEKCGIKKIIEAYGDNSSSINTTLLQNIENAAVYVLLHIYDRDKLEQKINGADVLFFPEDFLWSVELLDSIVHTEYPNKDILKYKQIDFSTAFDILTREYIELQDSMSKWEE